MIFVILIQTTFPLKVVVVLSLREESLSAFFWSRTDSDREGVEISVVYSTFNCERFDECVIIAILSDERLDKCVTITILLGE